MYVRFLSSFVKNINPMKDKKIRIAMAGMYGANIDSKKLTC